MAAADALSAMDAWLVNRATLADRAHHARNALLERSALHACYATRARNAYGACIERHASLAYVARRATLVRNARIACGTRTACVAISACNMCFACLARNARLARVNAPDERSAMQPRKIALGNQKGGVGKTASTLGLASAITAVGGKVLIVDMDQQGNTTGGLGVTLEEGMLTAYHLMNETREGIAAEAIIATPWDGVDLIPADEELGKIESDGSNDLVFRLDVAFEGLDLSPYDAVLFDCPPNMGKVLFAVLIAADGVVAITEPTIDSVGGVQKLEETIDTVRKRANPKLEFDKIVISRKRSTGEHEFRESELRETYGALVAKTSIPELAARQDAHSNRTPIHQFKGGKALTLQLAYSDLLAELPIVIGAPA